LIKIQNFSLADLPTAKFYSKYETGEAINLTPEKWSHYLSLVEGHLKNKPRDKYTEPITESQEYCYYF